jgi:hypothetical protein
MTRLIGVVIALGLFGCSDAKLCYEERPHKWSEWTDEWKKPNDFGYMQQRRYCEACGLIQIQSH